MNPNWRILLIWVRRYEFIHRELLASPPIQNGERGLAAAESVAAAFGKPPDNPPQKLIHWVEKLRDGSLSLPRDYIKLATKYVSNVLQSSELKELWIMPSKYGPQKYELWVKELQNLMNRLESLSEK